MTALVTILDEMGSILDNVMGTSALGEDAVQVVPRLNLNPSQPTSVDIYPGDPFRDTATAGFGDTDGTILFTVRARVTTPDNDGAQDQLLKLMDDEDELSIANALMDDPTLNGLVADTVVDSNTGFRLYGDNPGAMLGVEWRVQVLNLTS